MVWCMFLVQGSAFLVVAFVVTCVGSCSRSSSLAWACGSWLEKACWCAFLRTKVVAQHTRWPLAAHAQLRFCNDHCVLACMTCLRMHSDIVVVSISTIGVLVACRSMMRDELGVHAVTWRFSHQYRMSLYMFASVCVCKRQHVSQASHYVC